MDQSMEQMMANGAGLTAPAASGGFDAAEGWDSYWTFKAAGVDAEGYVPMPSQAKIDNFQRTVAKLFVDLDVAQDKESAARAKEFADEVAGEKRERTAEERMAEIEEALKLKRDVMNRFRDALALVCSDSPNRKQLGQLNEPTLIRFINFVGGLLNPNV